MGICWRFYASIIVLVCSTALGGFIIPDSGWIGSKSEPNAIQIDSTGNVLMPQKLDVTGLGTFGSLIVDTDTLVVDAVNHRVGIGTDTPDKALDVAGIVKIGVSSGYFYIMPNQAGAATLRAYVLDLAFETRNTTEDILFRTNNSGTTLMTVKGTGNVGISETAPETLLEMTSNAPYLTLHNDTEEDGDGGGESRIIFKREDGAGTETAAGQIEVSHDGAGANDQLGKMVLSVNTGAGLVAAQTIDSAANVTMSQKLILGTAGVFGSKLIIDSGQDAMALFNSASGTLDISMATTTTSDSTFRVTLSKVGDNLALQRVAGDVLIGTVSTDGKLTIVGDDGTDPADDFKVISIIGGTGFVGIPPSPNGGNSGGMTFETLDGGNAFGGGTGGDGGDVTWVLGDGGTGAVAGTAGCFSVTTPGNIEFTATLVDVTGAGAFSGILRANGGLGIDVDPTAQDRINIQSDINGLIQTLIRNVNAGASAVARSRVQSNAGSVNIVANSTAGGSTFEIFSTGGILSIFTNDDELLTLGSNSVVGITIDSLNVTVENNLFVENDLSVMGDLDIQGDLDVTGSAEVSDSLKINVTGFSDFANFSVVADGILTISTSNLFPGGLADIIISPDGVTKIGDGSTNNSVFSATGSFTQAGTAITTLDQLYLNEISTPTAIGDDGVLWTNSDNELRFISGDGQNHLVHGSAFSNIWFHGAVLPVTIGAQDTFFKVDTFVNVGGEDDMGNAVGNVTAGNNDITIGSTGAGTYEVAFGASITADGAARTMVLAAGIEFGTPKVITAMTGNLVSPIIVTIAGHPFQDGDMVKIVDSTGNTASIGQWFVLSATTDTFALHDIDGLTASTGDGTYDADSGNVSICYSGEILAHRKVAQNDFGNVSGAGDLNLLSGDKIGVYVLNLDAASDVKIVQITLHINREDQ